MFITRENPVAELKAAVHMLSSFSILCFWRKTVYDYGLCNPCPFAPRIVTRFPSISTLQKLIHVWIKAWKEPFCRFVL
jgi:hypothetical protein